MKLHQIRNGKMNKSRFDVVFTQVPKKEVLTIKCNYPHAEKGSIHLQRTYCGARAIQVARHMEKLLRISDEKLERFLVFECRIGSQNFSWMQIIHPEAYAVPGHIRDIMVGLGRMKI